MAGFFNKLKNASTGSSSPTSKDASSKKKDEPTPEMTPLEKMLQHAGPLREDGSDKFFGLENFGNTCYCNSIVQALFYSDLFRDHVLSYPTTNVTNGARPRVNVTIRPPLNGAANQTPVKSKGLSSSEALKRRQQAQGMPPGPGQPGIRPEDKPDSPEYKKKQAMIKGPILELAQENTGAYGMDECTFTGLKDIFLALVESEARTGVLSPQRFLEIFKRDNEMFRNSMHQDAHEFYGLVLNDVIANVEANSRRTREREGAGANGGLVQSLEKVVTSATATGANLAGLGGAGTGWVHDIFEGVLTSETKCLMCETASQRDETFLDLSIDLEEHSSVTSCLRKFSAEEMLCERNKFHCDHCGGLQEAEKRMKIKRLPKVLALHLKRFKYTEDYSRLQKLFHRVVYPYQLRMFNTTDDAEDPDRLYELYAIVIHIGGNAYHGHYVSVIKTKDRGWLLFDDEMVEPVDKHFVRNFFGDKPGMACAYVLFYQETTFEDVLAEQEAEGLDEIKIASEAADAAAENGKPVEPGPGLVPRQNTQPGSPTADDKDTFASLAHAHTAPVDPVSKPEPPAVPPAPQTPSTPFGKFELKFDSKSREEKKQAKKEQEAAEKARKLAEKGKAEHREDGDRAGEEGHAGMNGSADVDEGAKKKEVTSFLNRSNRGSKSMARKSFGFLSKGKGENHAPEGSQNGEGSVPPLPTDKPEKQDKLKDRFSFGLGKKKSHNVLS